jgi:ankyrin repeat protein
MGPAITSALQSCWDEMVELMLSRGARTDVTGLYGMTCLDLARESGSPRKVELILAHTNNNTEA